MSEWNEADLRAEVRTWLEENWDPNRGLVGWRNILADSGWGMPTWPSAWYGRDLPVGLGPVVEEAFRDFGAIGVARSGVRMLVAATLLEHGSDLHKSKFLRRILTGEDTWCQLFSEPGSGSDLASLKTRAVREGNEYVINGQKIWTTNAHKADWIFVLVRTDVEAPKHQGISFILFPMDQAGVTVKPIQLLSGTSPFCETFLDEVIAEKRDLVGRINEGWSVGKRLLQHERSGQGGLGPSVGRAQPVGVTVDLEVSAVALSYLGRVKGKIADPALRDEVVKWKMRHAAFGATQRRAGEEARAGSIAGEATSIFKLFGASLAQDRQELVARLMGSQGYGWEGQAFSEDELGATRSWLSSKAVTIYGGTNEIQKNIIAKAVLGL